MAKMERMADVLLLAERVRQERACTGQGRATEWWGGRVPVEDLSDVRTNLADCINSQPARYGTPVCGRVCGSCMNHGYVPIPRVSVRAEDAPGIVPESLLPLRQ
jgi:hypothetical protein